MWWTPLRPQERCTPCAWNHCWVFNKIQWPALFVKPPRQNKCTGSCNEGSNHRQIVKQITHCIFKFLIVTFLFLLLYLFCSTLVIWYLLTSPSVLNCNVLCLRVSFSNTVNKKGRALRNTGKYTSLTVISASFVHYLYYSECMCPSACERGPPKGGFYVVNLS